MDDQERRKAFAGAMTQVFHRAKKEANYTATRFAQMLGEHGAINTAKMLLHASAVSEGFVALWEAKRLDLTVEYQVLRPEFHDLFTSEELAMARQRLTDYGMETDTPTDSDRRSPREYGPEATDTGRRSRAPETTAPAIEGRADRPGATETPPADVLAEISMRRNAIERRLRVVLSQGLRYEYGSKAAVRLHSALSEQRRTALLGKSYDAVWDELYFNELRDLVGREWVAFEGWFGTEKDKVLHWFDHINRFRADAHARAISEEDLAYLRVCFKRLEEAVSLA